MHQPGWRRENARQILDRAGARASGGLSDILHEHRRPMVLAGHPDQLRSRPGRRAAHRRADGGVGVVFPRGRETGGGVRSAGLQVGAPRTAAGAVRGTRAHRLDSGFPPSRSLELRSVCVRHPDHRRRLVDRPPKPRIAGDVADSAAPTVHVPHRTHRAVLVYGSDRLHRSPDALVPAAFPNIR